MFDAALEPMFWFVDHFVRYLGPVSDCSCTLLFDPAQYIYYNDDNKFVFF